MVDPQTVNKFLNQPLSGSDVGTWDVPLNNNAGIIDNSFGGLTTIALTNAPVTLSPAQYQCVYVRLTGAISANVALTFPAVGSFYTIINDTTNSSAFIVTMGTTVAGGRSIGIPPGAVTDVMTDGTNARYKSLPPVGTYWDYGGSSNPLWNSVCTVPPYLNCDGTAFSSATYPTLTTILGGTNLPDSRGRLRYALNQTTGRITSSGGIDGDTRFATGGIQTVTLSSQNIPPVPLTDPKHSHTTFASGSVFGAGAGGVPVPIFAATQTSTDATGITAGSTSPSAMATLPPGYVGGLTLIRAG